MDFNKIQRKWQQRWEKQGIFKVKGDTKKKKFYCLEMFPYPSGFLHMGHVRNYSIGDTFARYKRMQGFSVLYPMGYDSFGMPAENAAIKEKADPSEWTHKNVKGIKAQQKLLGLSYDWDREISTCEPEYYKWNQWIFLKLLEKGLAYKRKSFVNWCPKCKTVLANEQVHDGKCWRCSAEVDQKELEQWFFKITEYADELLDDLKKLDKWPERVRIMQEHWIGKSEGVNIKFKMKESDETIETFTTRQDTLFGMTFIVIAPEHPKVLEWVKGTKYEKPTKEFIKKVKKLSMIERTTVEKKEKRGVFLGKYAFHPFTGKEIPIYVADFALLEFGTGIVQAVPAHDQRDFDFAKEYNLPIIVTVQPDEYEIRAEKIARAYEGHGTLVNSEEFNGMRSEEALGVIADKLEEMDAGKRTTAYKLKDWLISRQRYWGTPIPVVYCDKCGIVAIPEKDLPVLLPKDIKFTGAGNPLETSEEFKKCKCPKCGGNAKRETDTMDTFVDSSWYFLRYCSPKEDKLPFDKKAAAYWMPVDQYIGGIEHACMHLIYARFFTKALRDLGLLKFDEPFTRLLCQGMVIKDGAKMSKSLGNVVDPLEIIGKYGSDTARLIILFAALPEKELDWSDKGVEGCFRFLNRVARLAEEKVKASHTKLTNKEKKLIGKMHSTIKKVTEHIELFQLSLVIGALMELTNDIYKYKAGEVNKSVYDECCENLALMLAPFAPHLAEEMWEMLGKKGFISLAKWPKCDESKIDKKADALEEMIHNTISDIKAVQELTGIKSPKKITIIVASEWKYEFFKEMRKQLEKSFNVGEIIKGVMKNTKLKKHGAVIAKLVPKLVKEPARIPELVLDQKTEISNFEDNKDFLEKEFKTKVEIVAAEKSKEKKADSALPGKPAIVLE